MTTHSAVSHSPTAPHPPARNSVTDARVNVKISGEKPARYNLGMTDAENLDGEPDGGDFFGFGGGDPVYLGRSAKGDVCAMYVRFIGIETEYAGQE